MANVYAVKTGNWSDVTVWNTGALPTSADDVYSNNFTVTIDQNITVLSLRNSSATGITLGGGFTVSGSFTLNIGQLFWTVTNAALLTYTGTGTLNVVGSIPSQPNSSSSPSYCINITGNGAVNFVGNISSTSPASRNAILKNGTGKLTITGDITSIHSNTTLGVILVNQGDLEIIGNVYQSSTSATAAALINTIYFQSTGQLIITGSLINNSTCTLSTGYTTCVNIAANGYFKHVGTMNNTSIQGVCYLNQQLSSISIATGPFISSPSAMMPFLVYRMNYQITALSYIEFRDSSTNGALPPSAAAPATRLVAPSTVVDSPIPANVRNGVTYALGTLTGTAYIPNSASVAYGVPVDNTTGVALLTGDSWIAAISSSNDPFAQRLRNLATVQTTAAQIAAF